MRISGILFTLFRLLVPPALIFTAYLYLYPAAHGCAFPDAKPAEAGCSTPGQQKAYTPPEIAPFRLLALGDPQLEGDTSLPDPDAPIFPSLRLLQERLLDGDVRGLSIAAQDLFGKDVGKVFQGYRKKTDLWGNDLYLAHIYRSVRWWTQPTHTVVLGDLLGSQWIGDEEFYRRSDRYWNRVFKGGKKVERNITDANGRTETLGENDSWERRIIAVAGNNDIGYAGDIHEQRIERFEDAFGRVNWDIRFKLDGNYTQSDTGLSFKDVAPELHLIILNSMNLDDPAYDPRLQEESRNFLGEQLRSAYAARPYTGTVLLTHIPLHKEPGVCVDPPYFSYFSSNQGGGIREQNHLTRASSDLILDNLIGPDRHTAIVLNGHDHEGCDTYHYRDVIDTDVWIEERDSAWMATPFSSSASERADANTKGLREITVRSMMGSYHGNAGLLSAWFDHDAWEWKYEYDVCVLGVQHVWWAVHVLDIIVIGLGLSSVVAGFLEYHLTTRGEAAADKERKVKNA